MKALTNRNGGIEARTPRAIARQAALKQAIKKELARRAVVFGSETRPQVVQHTSEPSSTSWGLDDPQRKQVDRSYRTLHAMLVEMNDDLDPDDVVPSVSVMSRTRGLMAIAFNYLKMPLPPGLVSPDGYGGIRIYWLRDERSLELGIPEVGADYLFRHTRVESQTTTRAPGSDFGLNVADAIHWVCREQ